MTADDIARSCRDEAARLRERADLLHSLALVLDGELELGAVLELVHDAATRPLSERELAQEAPYGYKANGEPRKRRPPADPDYARKGWQTRRAKSKTARTTLRVLSSTHPTEAELVDRELVHTTEEPAA
jgi:hypothetical protein